MEGLRDKVRNIITKLDIDTPPVPIEKVSEMFHIPVIKYSYFPQSISGTIIREDDLSVIGVNDTHAKVRQRFTVAHELGHFLLGHDHTRFIDESFDEPDRREQEANKFAAELLIPFDFLKADIKKSGVTIPDLAKRYLVSEQAMSIRLLETNLINEIK